MPISKPGVESGSCGDRAAATFSARMWTRWWWMGSAVTEAELTRHLEAFAAAGIGGVEITPIYGVQGQESADIEYLSPRWIELWAHTLREARRLGLGVDMTLGTGWPWGGKHVSLEHAPRKLVLQKEELSAGMRRHCRFQGASIEAAAWHGADGTRQLVPFAPGGSELVWTAPASTAGTLYIACSKPTGQQVKRPAPGGEGRVMSPYSSEALRAFLKPFERLFAETGLKPRCLFYDSFEVFDADFTPGLFDRFRREKGYDATLHLDALAGDGDPERVSRVRCDYRDVLFACLLGEFAEPWRRWTRDAGMLSRYQAHGSPGNLLDLYAVADIPETEVFGANRFPWTPAAPPADELPEHYVIANKMASSAAHLAGRGRVASETFTWHREHFRSSLADMKGELDQLFLAGINHIFFHGTTYSPAEAPWPGWLFYASTHFDPAQPFWRDLPAFNAYIAACQEVLQNSRVVNDILLYFPFHDVMSAPDGALFRSLNVHQLDAWLIGRPWGETALRLWRDGYSFDIVSDRLLQTLRLHEGRVFADAAEYRAIVVPPCRTMPLETAQRLVELARAGAPALFMKDLPQSQPGLRGLDDGGAFAALLEEVLKQSRIVADYPALLGALSEKHILPNPVSAPDGTRALRLLKDGRTGWFIVNFSERPLDGWVTFAAEGATWSLRDPLTGRVGRAAGRRVAGGVAIYLQLHPGQSLFVFEPEAEPLPAWSYVRESGRGLELTGNWNLDFIAGGPALPASRTLTELQSWTLLDDTARDFSGTARYTHDFVFDGPIEPGDVWRLQFEEVHESVAVRLNDHPVATLWSRPMETDVTAYLRQGANRLVCEVTNLAANRIAAMDRQGVPWRIFKEINFVNIRYQPFNAADWAPMPSGLVGNVRLVRYSSFNPEDSQFQSQDKN